MGSGSRGGLCSLDHAMEPFEPSRLKDYSKYVSSSNGGTDVSGGIGSLRGGRTILTKQVYGHSPPYRLELLYHWRNG